MTDQITTPNVVTTLTYKNFKMHVYAYRRLSKDELELHLRRLMRERKWKRVPESGEVKVFSILGFDD